MNVGNRREFLSLVTGIAASFLVPWAAHADGPPGLADLRTDFLIGLGQAYLTQEPTEAEADQLRLWLGVSRSGQLDPARLRVQIAEEFRTGELVIVEGWHLSRSEARLYALLALD